MARVLLGNIEAGTTDEEIRALLEKYGFPAFDEIERVPGDGSHPAAMLNFHRAGPDELRHLRERFHDMYWKKRQLSVQLLVDHYR